MSALTDRPARQFSPRRTRRKMQVLEYVQATIAADGVPPSYGMICTALRIRTRTEVHAIIKRLEADRLIARVGAGRVRRLQLTATALTMDASFPPVAN